MLFFHPQPENAPRRGEMDPLITLFGTNLLNFAFIIIIIIIIIIIHLM
jgi:hypothetical protein